MTSSRAGIRLKSGLIDYYIFFLVFLFGVQHRRRRDEGHQGPAARRAVREPHHRSRRRPASSTSASAIRDDGRTAGAIGESNQYAAFIILFLPATIAAAVASRGLQRLFWLGAALVAVHDAGDDGLARRLRRPGHGLRDGRLSIPPSHFVQPHRRLGVRRRWSLLVLVVTLLAVRRTCWPNA